MLSRENESFGERLASKRERVAEGNKISRNGKTVILPRAELPVKDRIKKR